jgi:two-component system CheB/CheR fusion protein
MKTIKGAGGVTFAQDLGTAWIGSMPAQAVATGYVDFVLPPEGIAGVLCRLAEAHRGRGTQ